MAELWFEILSQFKINCKSFPQVSLQNFETKNLFYRLSLPVNKKVTASDVGIQSI